jgi:dextranase
MTLTISVRPDKGQYRPGEPVRLAITANGAPGDLVDVQAQVTRLADTVGSWSMRLQLDASGAATHTYQVDLPPARSAWEAFGVDLTAAAADEPAEATPAIDVAPHWQIAPRYGFLSDFHPDGDTDEQRLDEMVDLHLSCVQFYDWMYRHHTYVPPDDLFTDSMGRKVDLARVRRRISGCLERGMAPVAYASIYGAEQPFASDHADWLLYDLAGRPMSLADTFYIQDPSPDSGWRSHLLGEYRQALELGFRGLHCDTYGSPKVGIRHRDGDHTPVHLDQILPELVAEADALARSHHPDGGAVLNCVSGWPLEAVTETQSAAFYVEVWPPHSTYRDLHELILRARRKDRRRQIILAAYLPYFHRDAQADPAQARQGLRLTSSTIFASGGFHLLPGEGHGILADSYYPGYGRPDEQTRATMRDYWNFHTRYGPLLADPDARDVSDAHAGGPAREVVIHGAPYGPKAEPGTVWVIVKQSTARTVVHLVNLTASTDVRWQSPQPEPPVLTDLAVTVETIRRPVAVWTATPDNARARPQPQEHEIAQSAEATLIRTHIPQLHTWTALVIDWPAHLSQAPNTTKSSRHGPNE